MSFKFIFPDYKLAIINLLWREAKNIKKQRNTLSLCNYPDIAIINILIYFYLVFFSLFIHKHIYGGYFSITVILFRSLKVKVKLLSHALCNPLDYAVHGMLQARILEWGAFAFSREIFRTPVSCIADGIFTS